jgi:hypothetical protein
MGIRALILTPTVHICNDVDKNESVSGQLALTVEYYSIFKCDSPDKAGKILKQSISLWYKYFNGMRWGLTSLVGLSHHS